MCSHFSFSVLTCYMLVPSSSYCSFHNQFALTIQLVQFTNCVQANYSLQCFGKSWSGDTILVVKANDSHIL